MSETEPNVCEFCGQTLLDGRQCDCDAAMTHRSRLEAVDDAIYCIENMGKNFSEEELELLKQAAHNIVFLCSKKSLLKMFSAKKSSYRQAKTRASKFNIQEQKRTLPRFRRVYVTFK